MMSYLIWVLAFSIALNAVLKLWLIHLDRVIAREQARLDRLESAAARKTLASEDTA